MNLSFITSARAQSSITADQASGWFAIFRSDGGLQFIALVLAVGLAYAIRQSWISWFKTFFDWLAKKFSIGDIVLAERDKRIAAMDTELGRVEHEREAALIRVAQLEAQITWRDQQLSSVNETVVGLKLQVDRLSNTIRQMRMALISKQASDDSIRALLISLEEGGLYPQQRSGDRGPNGNGTPPTPAT